MAQTATADAASQSPASEKPQRQPMYGNRQKALDLLERCQQNARSHAARHARDRADLLNLKMYRGGEANQWLVWDSASNTYVERPTDGDAGLPRWFYRATTNVLGNKIDGIAAILNQSQPAKNWYATRDDDVSQAAAEVCELADPVLLDEIDYPHGLRPRLNKLVALTNLGAVVVTYDNDPKWGLDAMQVLQCASCQQYVHPLDAPEESDACPECGGALQPAVHPQTNQPIGVDQPKGRLAAEFLNSFEVSLPRSASVAHEDYNPWVSTHQRWSTEDAISRWPAVKALLDGSQTIKTSGGKATETAYADQMRDMAAPVSADQGGRAGATTSAPTGPVIWRLWHDPIDDEDFTFPDGVFLTALEGVDGPEGLLEFEPLPFKDDHGRAFKNVLLRQFTQQPGTAFGKPPADDLVPLQTQLNLGLALAFLILMHHASPRTFLPSSVTLLDQIGGMPGKVIGYRSTNPNEKPIVEPGQGFPEGLRWFLEFIIAQFDSISKLNAVLTGERPSGDPTLGEVQILQERGFAAFQEPLEALVAFERRLSLKLLWIARQCAWSERFAEIEGDDGAFKLRAFTGADLEGHVTVDIDLATAWPKSAALTNARLQHAFESGILNPQDPEVQEEYLRLNDLLTFKKSTDVYRDQVARQLEEWKHATSPQQITPPQSWWRLDYHLFRKQQFLNTETFEQIAVQRQDVAAAMIQHVQQLQQMLQPPAPPTEPAAPGKGDQGALQGAVDKGAIRPAGKPGGRGALDAAATSGAIRPAGTGAAVKAHQQKTHGTHIGDLVKQGAIRPKAGAPTAPGAAS